MSREWRFRLEDILSAAERILEYTQGMDAKTFAQDQRTVDAVIRNLEIIGEAARHIPPEVKEKFPELPWEEMRAMRNMLIHEYFGVDLWIIWQTIQQDVPSLIHQIRHVLQKTANGG